MSPPTLTAASNKGPLKLKGKIKKRLGT